MVIPCSKPGMLIARLSLAFLIASALAVALPLHSQSSIVRHTPAMLVPATSEDDSLLTVEDLLHAEDLGNAWFSPDSERVLFTRQRPAIEVVDRSYDDFMMTNQRLYVFERRTGRTREIAPPANATLSFISAESPWEPNGRGVLLICVEDGAYRLAYWSVATGTVTLLPGRPDRRSLPLAWINGRVAYPVLADEEPQRFAYRPLLETAGRKWEQAWHGDRAEVTVSSVNPLFATTRPAEGALMLSDTHGQAIKIADGDFIAVAPSPDGRYLAAVRLAETIARPMSVVGQRGELQIFGMGSGSATLLQKYHDLDVQGGLNYATGYAAIAWSPQSDRLLIGGKRIEEPRERARPFEIRLPEGAVHELPGGDVQFVDSDLAAAGALLAIGWLDAAPVAIAARPAHMSVSRQVQRTRLDYGERKDLRFDLFLLTSRGPQNLTAFSRSGTRSFIVRGDARSALVIADNALWRITSSRSHRLSVPSAGAVLDFAPDRHWPTPSPSSAYSRSGERVALLLSQDNQPVQRVVFDLKSRRPIAGQNWGPVAASSPSLLDTVVRNAQGWRRRLSLHVDGRESVLASVNEHMQRTAIAHATRFEYGSGDKQLVGWYLTPPMMTDTRPRPAIVFVYGGTIQGDEPDSFARATPNPPVFSGQLLAAQGYVVIYPSVPLEPAATSDPMTTLADQTVAAVDALVARGVVNAARVAVMGQSFGGWSTAAILARRSDRFRAGVAMAGLYDLAWSYGTVGMTELLNDDGRFQGSTVSFIENSYLRPGPLWKDPQAYIRASPIYYADRIDAPLLMLAGDLDIPATSLAGAMRMYNALVRAGKQPVLARYWGEGHVAKSPAAWRDQWDRVSRWFDHYLKQ